MLPPRLLCFGGGVLPQCLDDDPLLKIVTTQIRGPNIQYADVLKGRTLEYNLMEYTVPQHGGPTSVNEHQTLCSSSSNLQTRVALIDSRTANPRHSEAAARKFLGH